LSNIVASGDSDHIFPAVSEKDVEIVPEIGDIAEFALGAGENSWQLGSFCAEIAGAGVGVRVSDAKGTAAAVS
jgi:hypothetical protein